MLNGEGNSLLEPVTNSWRGFFLCLMFCKSGWLFVLTHVVFRNFSFYYYQTHSSEVHRVQLKLSCEISEPAWLVLPRSSRRHADVAAQHWGVIIPTRGILLSASLSPCRTSDCPLHCEDCHVPKHTLPQPWDGHTADPTHMHQPAGEGCWWTLSSRLDEAESLGKQQ